MNGPTYTLSAGGRSGVWRPVGAEERVGNPYSVDWSSGRSIAARLFVGFNVCKKPTHKMGDLVKIVKRTRIEQGVAPDASFIVQRGIYKDVPTPKDPKDCGIVEEDSAQVLIFAAYTEALKVFRERMLDLAGAICREFRQRSVIVSIEHNGEIQETVGVDG